MRSVMRGARRAVATATASSLLLLSREVRAALAGAGPGSGSAAPIGDARGEDPVFREMRRRILSEREEAKRFIRGLCGSEMARNVYYIPPEPGDPNSKRCYLLATVHFTEESKRQAQDLIKKLNPDSVVLEMDRDIDATRTGGVQLCKRLLGLGYYGAAYQELVNYIYEKVLSRKNMTGMDAEFGRAKVVAEQLGSNVVLADSPWYIRTQRLLNSFGPTERIKLLILSTLSGPSTPPTKEATERMTKPHEWIEEHEGESLIFGGMNFHMVQVHERDLLYVQALKQAKGNVVVGVFGAEHVRGIMDFWDVFEEEASSTETKNGRRAFDESFQEEILSPNGSLEKSLQLWLKVHPFPPEKSFTGGMHPGFTTNGTKKLRLYSLGKV